MDVRWTILSVIAAVCIGFVIVESADVTTAAPQGRPKKRVYCFVLVYYYIAMHVISSSSCSCDNDNIFFCTLSTRSITSISLFIES